MKTIGIGMLPEFGHLMPTLRLAQLLRERGHRVIYFGTPDFQDWVARFGFEFAPVFEEVFPRGTLERRNTSSAQVLEADKAAAFAAFGRYLATDALEARLRGANLDLLLGDTLNDFLLASACSLGIPCIRLTTSLPQSAAPGVPPLSSDLPFGASDEGRANVEAAWEHLLAQRCSSTSYHAVKLHILTTRFGYPKEKIDMRGAFELELPDIPELVLGPPSFDFPRPPSEMRHYVESLWLSRPEDPLPSSRLDRRKPLVYAALGTQTHRIATSSRFRALIRDTAALMPDYQFVLALRGGDGCDVPPPNNLVELEFAPQLQLLELCDVAVTHGGLGTLKEAFYFGKPVLVFPGGFDQPGNAARVIHHGLGHVGALENAEAPDVARTLQELASGGEWRSRVREIRADLHRLEECRPGLRFVESH